MVLKGKQILKDIEMLPNSFIPHRIYVLTVIVQKIQTKTKTKGKIQIIRQVLEFCI